MASFLHVLSHFLHESARAWRHHAVCWTSDVCSGYEGTQKGSTKIYTVHTQHLNRTHPFLIRDRTCLVKHTKCVVS